jgi:hypothetical protein
MIHPDHHFFQRQKTADGAPAFVYIGHLHPKPTS